MNEYTPKLTDPRVFNRISKAIGFAVSSLSDKPQQISKLVLDKVFGQQQHPLTRYLRSKLLVVAESRYLFFVGSKDRGVCKQYILNVCGLDQLLAGISADAVMSNKSLNYYNGYTILLQYCIGSRPKILKDKFSIEYTEVKLKMELLNKHFEYKDKEGRLWTPFQNVRKEVKQNLLPRYGFICEYDIEACAPTLIYQHAKANGLKKAPFVEYYLDNKTAERERMSKESGISVKGIKVIITALFSGARFDRSIKTTLYDMDQSCYLDQVRWLKNDPFIKALRKDISRCWAKIKTDIDRQSVEQGYATRRISSKIKWAVYFSLERKVLNVVRQHLADTNNKCILEHDGWTTEREVDLEVLLSLIKQETEFDVKVSMVKLENVELIPTI